MKNPLRLLSVKLTLAFLLVGLTGSIVVALAVRWRTQQEFDQFVLNNYERQFVTDLVEYYAIYGTWEGVEDLAFLYSSYSGGSDSRRLPPITLVDVDGTVVVGRPEQLGRHVDFDIRKAVRLKLNDTVIGYMLLYRPDERWQPNTPEAAFINQLSRGIVASAITAVGLALLISLLLARAISRPVRELREATQVVAGGELGVQVPVRTDDEIGQLAASFNRMSADLAHSNDLRRQMTADIAHDLRTPLTVILGYTEALSEGKLDGTQEAFDVMHEEARRLQRLIEDLRILTLADAGELPLMKRAIHVVPLLEQVAASHTPRAEEKDITLDVAAAEDLPEVEMDPDRIAQVLGNLINNALRYTPRGGRVTLGAARTPGAVAITVSDTGTGISEEHLPHIFERFYRADAARHTDDMESGLGLAIAKSIVEAHGGTLAVASQPGAGTTFTISLPA